jgi:hypothetical protein
LESSKCDPGVERLRLVVQVPGIRHQGQRGRRKPSEYGTGPFPKEERSALDPNGDVVAFVLVCVYAIVDERPANTPSVERQADGPIDSAADSGPAKERTPVERQACIE